MVSVAAFIVIAGASSARADQKIAATVPFDFIVGDSRLPAGDYIVAELSDDPGVLSVASVDGRQFTFALTIPVPFNQPLQLPELTFQWFGGQRFLARIVPATGDGRAILLTPAIMERELVAVALSQ
jgi:hypothetical protein